MIICTVIVFWKLFSRYCVSYPLLGNEWRVNSFWNNLAVITLRQHISFEFILQCTYVSFSFISFIQRRGKHEAYYQENFDKCNEVHIILLNANHASNFFQKGIIVKLLMEIRGNIQLSKLNFKSLLQLVNKYRNFETIFWSVSLL